MTPEQWSRAKTIFNEAMERDESERRAFVAAEAADDDEVRSEVERLLDAASASGGFIEQPAASALLNGRVISHYEVVRLLGSGGMGHVYVARDTELGREVALKVASFGGADAQVRLRREAQHASRLSHPHICHIYDVGRTDGQLFVVMELVPGRSLAELVSEGPLSAANARRYGMEIADALSHAHEHGITHRDLKSTNVMITPNRGAKVLDFGLARMLDTHQIDALSHSQRSLTDEGSIAGTLPYMAPELLRGQRGDQRSDIWALGVLLHEMVTGQRPFTGGTGFEVSAAILHQPPGPLPSSVPTAMRTIIQRCLEKDPSQRYQHAPDVRQAPEAMRARYVPRRIGRSVALFVLGLLVAAVVVYAIRGKRVTNALSNVYAYSLLEEGAVKQALEEFKALTDNAPTDVNAWDSLGEGYLANGMPAQALEAYSRALTINARYTASIMGRGLALAGLGRYDEAREEPPTDFRVHAFLLSRVGRYRDALEALEQGRREDDDAEVNASALLTSAWLSIERQLYGPALEDIRAAEQVLADRPKHSLLVLAELLGGIAEIRAGNVKNAEARLASQKSRYSSDNAMESNWVAALEGEIALAEGQYDRAIARFKAARKPAWSVLGRDQSTVLAANLPSRDGIARVQIARGDRAGAVEEYRRLTTAGPDHGSSAVLEPRYILALARLLREQGDKAGASAEYGRFLQLWAQADAGLPELAEAKQALNAAP